MTAARHLLIRDNAGRTMVVDERTGSPAGVLVPIARDGGPAFVWSRFALWFALGIAGGYMLARIIP